MSCRHESRKALPPDSCRALLTFRLRGDVEKRSLIVDFLPRRRFLQHCSIRLHAVRSITDAPLVCALVRPTIPRNAVVVGMEGGFGTGLAWTLLLNCCWLLLALQPWDPSANRTRSQLRRFNCLAARAFEKSRVPLLSLAVAASTYDEN
jgi:hypothetical protein